jgi:multicomponent K+:H+ antiporter subunit E
MTGRRWLPHPRLSLCLALLWLLLAQSWSAAHLLLGAVLGLGLPLLTRGMLPDLPRIRRPGRLVAYVLLVLWDILIANLKVAKLTLGPLSRLNPCVVVVPLDTRNPVIASLLAATVTLTPGTVSMDIDMAARQLTVHGLDVPDAAALVDEIKSRYERRLMEIFE